VLAVPLLASLASSRRDPYFPDRPYQRVDPFLTRGPSAMPDTALTCRDCGQTFTFTSGEQDFYASRGYSEPSRCPDCRAARKAERDRGGGGHGSYGGGGGYGSRGPRELFSATCSSCGQEARVPFQPSGDKPVYCSACFQQRGGGSRSGAGYGGGYARSRY
jgi:CxxC-x17-CxxC domain-containing protein